MKTLAQTLNELSSPVDLPQLLPPVHSSIVRWFSSIAEKGRLEPRKCSVFNKKLLYLFYGGVFYRPPNVSTKKAVELPIAFVFDPRVLSSIFRYYPFDTGAMAGGRFGEWKDKLIGVRCLSVLSRQSEAFADAWYAIQLEAISSLPNLSGKGELPTNWRDLPFCLALKRKRQGKEASYGGDD